jgi:transcriptional regulator GlxA family with amidase domain
MEFMTAGKIDGFRLGIYVFEDAEVVDFAAPYGVFSVARRYDPALDVFLVAETLRPVQAQAGFTVLPNYDFASRPAMNAFLIPGGMGTRPETYNARLHEFIRALPPETLLTSVCTGSWVLARAGLLDGLPATSRKEPDRAEARPPGMVPIDRLASLAPACHVSRARVVDAGRIITAGGITAGMEMGFHLLRRAGYDEAFIDDVARVMEYTKAYDAYRDDRETVAQPGGGS